MINRDKNAASKNIKPLRIHGKDWDYYNIPMDKNLTFYAENWVFYPDIFAEHDKKRRNQNDDLIVHPKYCNLFEHKTSIQKRRQSVSDQICHLDKDLVLEAFKIASCTGEYNDHITPYQLLNALIKLCNNSAIESDEKITYRIDGTMERPKKRSRLVTGQVGDYATIECNDCSSEIKALIASFYCLFKELHFLAMLDHQNKTGICISIEGQCMGGLSEPIPYTKDDPLLDLGPSMPEKLRYVDMTAPMHCASTGGSGSGKTANMIIPRLKAHLGYTLTDGTKGTALIVDPKRELASITKSHLTKRGEQDRFFMAGYDGRLRLYPKNTPLSLDDRVTLLADELDLNPNGKGNSATWIAKSVRLLKGFVFVYAYYHNQTGRNIFSDILSHAGYKQPTREGFWHYFQSIIYLLQEGYESIVWMHKFLGRIAEKLALPEEQSIEFRLLSRYASMEQDEAPTQLAYVTGNIEPALTTLCDEGLAQWLDTTPVPEVPSGRGQSFDLKELIDTNKVIVFQPTETPSGDRGTRLVKAQFNRVAMERRNLRQPVLFVCDEFQRYISNDNESGEASLLDRCRAYRITFVCATQSINALYDALSKRNQGGNPEFAVKSIMANIAHLFFFHTNDQTTITYLKNALPQKMAANLPHPLEVLPLSGLRVGEAYFVAPQGKWGRVQFKLIGESKENLLNAA